jgi:hypothetical protein
MISWTSALLTQLLMVDSHSDHCTDSIPKGMKDCSYLNWYFTPAQCSWKVFLYAMNVNGSWVLVVGNLWLVSRFLGAVVEYYSYLSANWWTCWLAELPVLYSVTFCTMFLHWCMYFLMCFRCKVVQINPFQLLVTFYSVKEHTIVNSWLHDNSIWNRDFNGQCFTSLLLQVCVDILEFAVFYWNIFQMFKCDYTQMTCLLEIQQNFMDLGYRFHIAVISLLKNSILLQKINY